MKLLTATVTALRNVCAHSATKYYTRRLNSSDISQHNSAQRQLVYDDYKTVGAATAVQQIHLAASVRPLSTQL